MYMRRQRRRHNGWGHMRDLHRRTEEEDEWREDREEEEKYRRTVVVECKLTMKYR